MDGSVAQSRFLTPFGMTRGQQTSRACEQRNELRVVVIPNVVRNLFSFHGVGRRCWPMCCPPRSLIVMAMWSRSWRSVHENVALSLHHVIGKSLVPVLANCFFSPMHAWHRPGSPASPGLACWGGGVPADVLDFAWPITIETSNSSYRRRSPLFLLRSFAAFALVAR
jgi:hypothetical protein